MSNARDLEAIVSDLREATGEMNRLLAEAEGQGIRMDITVHERETIQLARDGPYGPTYKDVQTGSTRIDWEASEIVRLGGLHE